MSFKLGRTSTSKKKLTLTSNENFPLNFLHVHTNETVINTETFCSSRTRLQESSVMMHVYESIDALKKTHETTILRR